MRVVFVEVDLIQAEWVVTGFCARDAQMMNVIRTGADPHIRTGSLMSKASEDFVRIENELVGHLTDPVDISKARLSLPKVEGDIFLPRNMSIRQMGKKANHGFNYNMQYKRVALEWGIPENEAGHIVSLYRDDAYPGLKDYYAWIEYELRNNERRLTNCFSQTREFLDELGYKLLDEAYSFLPQSTVANVTNFGMRDVYWDTARYMRRVELRDNVHDSLLTHHEFESYTELAAQCLRVMDHMTRICEYHDEAFILGRELKIGLDWGEFSRHHPTGMREVIKVPVNRSVDFVSADLPMLLEEAYEAAVGAEAT